MNIVRKCSGLAGVLVALAVGVVIGVNVSQPAVGQGKGEGKYSVVHTEGTNLIVQDKNKNVLYFYTTDKGAEPGADLKLRGTLDLTQVGKDTIKPKLHNKQ